MFKHISINRSVWIGLNDLKHLAACCFVAKWRWRHIREDHKSWDWQWCSVTNKPRNDTDNVTKSEHILEIPTTFSGQVRQSSGIEVAINSFQWLLSSATINSFQWLVSSSTCCSDTHHLPVIEISALCKSSSTQSIQHFLCLLRDLQQWFWHGVPLSNELSQAAPLTLDYKNWYQETTDTAVNRRRQGFSGCCLSCLERSATARHGCRISACLLQSPQDSSL